MVVALGLVAACSPGGCSTGDAAGSISPVIALPIFGHTVPGKPVDLYVRIARLAKSCWFAPPAPLQQGYVFTADVSPENRGGAGNITIFQRNAATGRPVEGERGLKAYAIALTPSGEGTAIAVENTRIAEAFAARMGQDVERWAAGETSCGEATPWPTSAALGDAIPSAPALMTARKAVKPVAAKVQ